ncbi:MAG TPA: hypothetical protein VMW72_00665 [Sedimentisphaerales bacterium]|nr:hypothetical protein [Sedimentisphaerales bacterium]
MYRKLSLVVVVVCTLLLGGMIQAAGLDITAPGDTVQGVPNDNDWPGNESPPLAIDDNTATKYLHFKGFTQPTGFQVTPSASQTIVVGVTFTTANDATERDPVGFELYGSNVSINGPYTLIASGNIVDFSQTTAWPRFTMNETPILFDNDAAYDHYQVLFTAVRTPGSANSMQISEVELLGMGLNSASPVPDNGAMIRDTWVSLSWLSGDFAASHDVYLGENYDDVDAGTGDTFQSNQTVTYFTIGFPGFPYPDGLVPGTTYYWRIDDVEADGTTIHKGKVWSFMITPKVALNPNPVDGTGFVDPNVVLSWEPGFGAMLHYVYFGDNFADVDNGTPDTYKGPSGFSKYTPGTLETGKAFYWRVDEFNGFETNKGDVWGFTTPGAVGSLVPSNGAQDVRQTLILKWSPGESAASHEVYFGTDQEAVRNANTGSPEYKGSNGLGSESYDPGKLEWDMTYYWRVDGVDNANPDSPWVGLVWSFTTANFLIVDDFELYNDLDPADPESNRIFNVWLDGYLNPTNGSLVGYESPPFAEQTIVHGGSQSMPLYYDNSVSYSEATLTLTYPRDWTENGVKTLTIWFRGDSTNAAEPLYVALNGNAIVTHDNPNAAQVGTWIEWNIDLQAFADQGVNLTNVNTIAIGLGNRNNPLSGGSGTMYIDDIRLYPPPLEPAP